MTAHEIRKQLLIAESELNRAQLIEDIATLKAGARTITDRFQFVGSIARSAASLLGGFGSAKHGPSADSAAKPSWLQTILKSAGLVTTIWSAFRPTGHEPESE